MKQLFLTSEVGRVATDIAKRMEWYDFSLVKLTVFFATLFLLTAWQGFQDLALGIAWYWYLMITIMLLIPLLKKLSD